MSYSVYSPVDVKVTLLDSSGAALGGATSVDNVDAPGPGGVVNYDSVATATVPNGNYLLQITSSGTRIPASKFSAGFDLVDADGHYLVALAVNGDINATGATDMGSCVSVNNVPQSASFNQYNAPAQKEQATGCGLLSSASGGGGPFFGGMMQVLTAALVVQILRLMLRNRRKPALAQRRR
jgi:hypothetical protein